VNVRRASLRESFQRKTPPAGAAAFIAHAVLTGDHALRRAFEQTYPLAVDLFGIDGASHTGTGDGEDGGENRVTYPGYTRRDDLTDQRRAIRLQLRYMRGHTSEPVIGVDHVAVGGLLGVRR
jgi:hypothetical protein